MDLDRLCTGIGERVALELRDAAADEDARAEILIAALYEISRSVLPALGQPRKSPEYRKAQGEVLDLVSCVVIPLVRGGRQRGVAVLSELAEGCLDPLLRRKLTVYAQELLAKGGEQARAGAGSAAKGAKAAAWVTAASAATALALFLAWPGKVPEQRSRGAQLPPSTNAADAAGASAPAPAQPQGAPAAAPGSAGQANRMVEQSDPSPLKREKGAPLAAAAPHGGQVTRVRVVNSQVLVPVTLTQGGATVKLELVLDTGATRTVLHEGVASRLGLDLLTAKSSLNETADGRMIRSRLARIDGLSVGPFAHAGMEVELIPYSGSEALHEGLLGMDFLAGHPYRIDMEHELIRWF